MDFTDRKNIVRRYDGQHKNYKAYKKYLAEDFYHRCAYCDTLESIITTPFEIDHFIPRKIFEGIKDELLNDYKNLVYSCKKCNIAKGSKHQGDIHSDNPTNELFYDPTQINYNDVFYRNEKGIIMSDDPKGKNMIAIMRLYRPIYALAWIIGQANQVIDLLEKRLKESKSGDEQQVLEQILVKLEKYTYKISRIFIANYNSNDYVDLE